MANSSEYTAGGPAGIRKINKQVEKKSLKFRAAKGYMGQAPGGMFKKGRGRAKKT